MSPPPNKNKQKNKPELRNLEYGQEMYEQLLDLSREMSGKWKLMHVTRK